MNRPEYKKTIAKDWTKQVVKGNGICKPKKIYGRLEGEVMSHVTPKKTSLTVFLLHLELQLLIAAWHFPEMAMTSVGARKTNIV